jgi:hypothetical protein
VTGGQAAHPTRQFPQRAGPKTSAARRAGTEGVAVWVDHHPPQFLVGLFRGLGRSKLSGVLGRLFQVIDAEVQVVLLGMLLARPRWTRSP